MRFSVFFLFAFSLVFSSSGFAATCDGPYIDVVARDAACESWAAGPCRNVAAICGDGSSSAAQGYDQGAVNYRWFWSLRPGDSCPEGTSLNVETGKCEKGYDCKSGDMIDTSWAGAPVSEICLEEGGPGKGCVWSLSEHIFIPLEGTSGSTWGSFVSTGGKCTLADSPSFSMYQRKPIAHSWEKDNRFSISNTDEIPQNSVCSDNGDGTSTCQTVEQTVTTETLGAGDYVRGTANETTRTYFDGNTRETTNTKTTTDDGHGNVSTQTTNTVVFTSGGYSSSSVSSGGGSSSSSSEGGVTDTSTQTETETVDSSGHKVTNYESTGGDSGGVDGTGSGAGGSGGSGSGGGDCTGTDCGDEEEPSLFNGSGPDGLYEPTTKTYASVISAFQSRLQSAAFYQSVAEFFTVSIAGSCPVWVIPGVMGMPSIPVDMQCSSTMESIWPYISAIMIATAGFIGFRWAFL